MTAIFYFIAGRKPKDVHPDALRDWGLSYCCDQSIASREAMSGPEGQPGLCFVDAAQSGGLGYHPDRQTWRKIPPVLLAGDAPEIFVGFQTDEPPNPEQLARPRRIDGHWLTLGDGNRWHVPAAISIDDAADVYRPLRRLPTQSRLGDDGKWTSGDVRGDLAELWEIATAFHDTFFGAVAEGEEGAAASVSFDFARAHEAAVAALAVNYRVGPVECDALGLLDVEACGRILQAVIDWPTTQAWMQKKTEAAAAGSGSSAGQED